MSWEQHVLPSDPVERFVVTHPRFRGVEKSPLGLCVTIAADTAMGEQAFSGPASYVWPRVQRELLNSTDVRSGRRCRCKGERVKMFDGRKLSRLPDIKGYPPRCIECKGWRP